MKEVATSSAKPASIRVGKVKQTIVEEEKKSESEGENDEDSVESSSLIPDGRNGDDEEGPVFENEQEELKTFRSLKFPPGLLRVFRDARNADFQDVRIYKLLL